MRTSITVWSMLSAWFMAVMYDRIEMMTGMEINVLLGAAITTMVGGLYFGLYANDKRTSKEEA